jgi:hypothetical protein
MQSRYSTNDPPLKQTPVILKQQDVCIVFVNADSGEGYMAYDGIRGDRNDLYAQKGGEGLIVKVASGCGDGEGSTIVVIHSVGPVVVDGWIDLPGVKAVVMANLPGQESGSAIADILLGNVNPSGKLPYTIGKSLEDYGPGAKILYYPNAAVPQQNFSEGLYIDYRYFDKEGIQPLSSDSDCLTPLSSTLTWWSPKFFQSQHFPRLVPLVSILPHMTTRFQMSVKLFCLRDLES